MDIGLLMFVTAIFSIIQISVWQLFPVKLKDILMANPIFAFLVNLAGSGLIASFTGMASIVGICNMGASVIFGIYAVIYSKQKGIKGLGISWYTVLGFIPIFPRIMVQYEKDGKEYIL